MTWKKEADLAGFHPYFPFQEANVLTAPSTKNEEISNEIFGIYRELSTKQHNFYTKILIVDRICAKLCVKS